MRSGRATGPPDAELTVGSMIAGIYSPQLLFGIGQGAIAPVIVFTALDLGASPAVAGFVAGLVGLGHVLGDLPAGQLVARIGERRAMQVAVALLLAALLGCVLAPSLWVFGIAVTATGLAVAVWGLARHLYLTEMVPLHLRARALSSLGGVQRIGLFVGPFLGAASLALVGSDGPYWVFVVGGLAASLALVASRRALPESEPAASDPTLRGLATVVRQHARVLRTLGTAALLVGALRASRQAVIPLWGNEIGLDPATTSVVFGLSGAVDMLLFYPAGKAMDRFGRRWVAVPSMAVLGAAFLLLPLTRDVTSMAAVAVLMGVGNGMASGIIMTISADAAPPEGRGQFLSAFRLISDLGMTTGPFLIGAVTAVTALTPAILAAGAVGGLASLALARWVPRHPVAPIAPAAPAAQTNRPTPDGS